MVLSRAMLKGWVLKQLDVNNVFMNGELQEKVLMKQPLGFIDSDHPDWVCKLKKSIYLLKHEPQTIN